MTVYDIIHNGNSTAEFPFVIRVTDDYGEVIEEYFYNDNIPEWVNDKEVVYLDCVNGYSELSNMAVMIIDIYEE